MPNESNSILDILYILEGNEKQLISLVGGFMSTTPSLYLLMVYIMYHPDYYAQVYQRKNLRDITHIIVQKRSFVQLEDPLLYIHKFTEMLEKGKGKELKTQLTSLPMWVSVHLFDLLSYTSPKYSFLIPPEQEQEKWQVSKKGLFGVTIRDYLIIEWTKELISLGDKDLCIWTFLTPYLQQSSRPSNFYLGQHYLNYILQSVEVDETNEEKLFETCLKYHQYESLFVLKRVRFTIFFKIFFYCRNLQHSLFNKDNMQKPSKTSQKSKIT